MKARGAAILLVLSVSPAVAAVVPVSTAAELTAAIANAAPGDEIVLASGTYALTGAMCVAVGTVDAPIAVLTHGRARPMRTDRRA